MVIRNLDLLYIFDYIKFKVANQVSFVAFKNLVCLLITYQYSLLNIDLYVSVYSENEQCNAYTILSVLFFIIDIEILTKADFDRDTHSLGFR